MTSSKRVALREITKANFHECIRLAVAADQTDHVAPNVFSLAQAKVNPLLHPFAIYDGAILGREPCDDEPMVGFVMYQVMDGIGFIMRLMVDEAHQGQGSGRAAMVEVLRRLKATPEVERIATSVAKDNAYVERFYRNLGFIDSEKLDERELYLKLDWTPS
jgi:diamine N-acetyltransferase